MILKRNNHRRILNLILGVALLCFTSILLTSHTTFANTNIGIGELKFAAGFKLDKKEASQGGIVTKNNYVFTDCGIEHCTGNSGIWVVNRNSCSTEKKLKYTAGYLTGIYNLWGSDKVSIVSGGTSVVSCLKLDGEQSSFGESRCPAPPYLAISGINQGVSARYNGHVFKVSGNGKFGDTIIGVGGNNGVSYYKISTGNIIKIIKKAGYKITYIEPQQISVDGGTGEVYISYQSKINGKRYIFFIKINSSVFKNFTGKSGTGSSPVCKNSKASGGSSSETRTAEKSVVDKNPKTEEYSYESQYEYDGTVDTLFFGTLQEDGEGCGIYTVLDLVITILTMGIGIAAAIGISISGIMYLTAKGNVARATKAKRRIYEIVIGLIAYAAIFAILTFLLPELNPELKSCKVLTTEEVAARDAARKEAREAAAKAAAEAKAKETDTTTEKTNGGNKTNADIRKELARVAKELAQSKKKYLAAFESSGTKAWEAARCRIKHQCNAARREGKSCSSFVATVVRTVIPSQKKKYGGGFPTVAYPTIYNYVKNPKNNWKEISKSQAGPGDIEIQHGPKGQSDSHVSIIYAKTKSGKLKVAEASNGTSWPHLTDGNKNYHPGLKGWPKYYRYTGN